MFNLYPYANMHNLNLDWIISRVKELGNRVDSFSAELREYVREYLSEFLQDGTLDVAAMLGGYVNINAFNPAADGVTDDSAAFAEAVRFCNTYNVNLCCNPGARYYVASPVAENMLHSIDGRGCIFVMGGAAAYDTAFITIGTAGINRSYNAADYDAGVFNPSELKNASFFLVSKDDLGQRGTFDYHMYASRMVVTDPAGNMINGHLPFNMDDSWRAKNIRPRGEVEKCVKNIYIEYGTRESDYTFGFAKFVCNNGVIENVHVFGQITNPDTYTGAVLTFEHASNCRAINVDGVNPTVSPGSGYLLGFFGCDNTHIADCACGNGTQPSWNAIGSNFMSNTVVERCQINMIDCHYMSFDSFIIRDSVVEKVSLPEGGCGDFTISNCTIVAKKFSPIARRKELNIVFNGFINIDKCHVVSNRENHTIVEYDFNDSELLWGNSANATLHIHLSRIDSEKNSYSVFFRGHNRLAFAPTVEVDSCTFKRTTNLADVHSSVGENINIVYRGMRRTGSFSYLFGTNERAVYLFDGCNIENVATQSVQVNEAIFANCRLNNIFGSFTKLIIHGCIISASTPSYTATSGSVAANIPDAWNV